MESDMDEQIVLLLKNNLQIHFTLMQFADLANRDLLELLNKVIHAISDSQPEKLGIEKIETTVDRISEFLRVLKFEFPCPPEEWDRKLSEADPGIIHLALLFLLRDMDEMKKRAYIAKYMEDDHIPEEIAVDPTIQEMLTQLRELREKFEGVYQEYESLGATNVEELKNNKNDLDADKARLANKINAFKRKLSNVKNLSELLTLTGKLRAESEREIKLNEQIERLNDEKRLLMHRQQVSYDRMKNMKSRLEQTLQEKRQELAAFKNAGHSSSTEEKGLQFMQQQVIAATNRKEQKESQLQELQNKRADAEKELQEKQAQGVIEVPAGNQFTAYLKKLKTKNETYKQVQSEISVLRKELAVMMRTEAIVQAQQDSVREEIERVEKAKGITGIREARIELERISATKADLDDVKGKTLEEMSQIVQEINRNIQSRKNELKPLVNSLQEKRKEKAEVETRYLQAKQKYNNAVSEYQTVCMGLDEECKKIRADIAQYQSKFFNIQIVLAQQQRAIKRVEDEVRAVETGNPIGNIKTYTDYFQKEIFAMKKRNNELKDQKKAIGGQSVGNQKQLDAFQSLRRLLEVKLKCQKTSKEMREKEKIIIETETNNPDERLIFDQ